MTFIYANCHPDLRSAAALRNSHPERRPQEQSNEGQVEGLCVIRPVSGIERADISGMECGVRVLRADWESPMIRRAEVHRP